MLYSAFVHVNFHLRPSDFGGQVGGQAIRIDLIGAGLRVRCKINIFRWSIITIGSVLI